MKIAAIQGEFMGTDFDVFAQDLLTVDFTEEDVAEAELREVNEEELAAQIEDVIDIVPTKITRYAARKETKEVLREEMAKFNALGRVFNSGVDHYRDVEQSVEGETVCLMFSDWHFGKVIKNVAGEIVFDSEVAFKRVAEHIAPQVVSNIKKLGRNSNVEDVQIFLLGDMIDNDVIYHTQRLHIDKPVASQFHDCSRAIMLLLGGIRSAFDEIGIPNIPIKIDCISGNHGRSAAVSKDEPGCSWDTALYSCLQLALKYSALPDISLDFSLDKYKVVEIRGHTGLLRHGAPSHSETAGAKAKLGGWNEIFKYDFICNGHVHHWGVNTYNGKPMFRNGALCGVDDYAIEMAVSDSWGQLMWGVSQSDVPTWIHRLR